MEAILSPTQRWALKPGIPLCSSPCSSSALTSSDPARMFPPSAHLAAMGAELAIATPDAPGKPTATDRHGNSGPAAFSDPVAPNSIADERRIGVRPTGSYWGSAGEQIDLLSGNLNFSLPLLKPQARGGWGATLMLSYNSQLWRQDGDRTRVLGKDVGYLRSDHSFFHHFGPLSVSTGHVTSVY